MSPLNVVVSSAVKIFRCSTPVAAVVGTGMHCLSQYMTDIGVRKDVLKSRWRIWHCSEAENGEEVIRGR
ncbi:hypothetical protein Tco_1195466 [Tanacetum coccineum]